MQVVRRKDGVLDGGPSHIVHPWDLAPALMALDARLAIQGPQRPSFASPCGAACRPAHVITIL